MAGNVGCTLAHGSLVVVAGIASILRQWQVSLVCRVMALKC